MEKVHFNIRSTYPQFLTNPWLKKFDHKTTETLKTRFKKKNDNNKYQTHCIKLIIINIPQGS